MERGPSLGLRTELAQSCEPQREQGMEARQPEETGEELRDQLPADDQRQEQG